MKKMRIVKSRLLSALGLQGKATRAEYFSEIAVMVAIGMVVGAAMGLTLAPKPGSQLRAELRNKMRRRRSDPFGERSEQLTMGSSAMGT